MANGDSLYPSRDSCVVTKPSSGLFSVPPAWFAAFVAEITSWTASIAVFDSTLLFRRGPTFFKNSLRYNRNVIKQFKTGDTDALQKQTQL